MILLIIFIGLYFFIALFYIRKFSYVDSFIGECGCEFSFLTVTMGLFWPIGFIIFLIASWYNGLHNINSWAYKLLFKKKVTKTPTKPKIKAKK